jgi:hypothetical protein
LPGNHKLFRLDDGTQHGGVAMLVAIDSDAEIDFNGFESCAKAAKMGIGSGGMLSIAQAYAVFLHQLHPISAFDKTGTSSQHGCFYKSGLVQTILPTDEVLQRKL